MWRILRFPMLALCIAAGVLLTACREERTPAAPRGAAIAVPEPSTLALLGTGLGGVVGYRVWVGRKRKTTPDPGR